MVADATVLGMPVNAPVVVSKLIPGGVELIAKLVIAPPVELIVNPLAAVFTVLLSEDAESVKVGEARKVPEVITRLPVPSLLTATNKPLPYVTEYHWLPAAELRLVQVIPSGLVITRLFVPVILTATNRPLPYVTEYHWLPAAELRLVQVIPSGLVIT